MEAPRHNQAKEQTVLLEKWQKVLHEFATLKESCVTPRSILENIGIQGGELISYSSFTKECLDKNLKLKTRIDERAKNKKQEPSDTSFWVEDYNDLVENYDKQVQIFAKLTIAQLIYILKEGDWYLEDINVLVHIFGVLGGDEDSFGKAYNLNYANSDQNPETLLRLYTLICEMKSNHDIIPTNTYQFKAAKYKIEESPTSKISAKCATPEYNHFFGNAFRFYFEHQNGDKDSIYFDNPLGLYVENENSPIFWASFVPDFKTNSIIVNQLQGKKGMTQQEGSLMDYTKFLLDLIAKHAINSGFQFIKVNPAIANRWLNKTYEGTNEAHATYERLWRIYDRKALQMNFKLDQNGLYSKKLTK
jgi:hypothetical protein